MQKSRIMLQPMLLKDEDKFEEELAEAEKEQDEEEASIHID